MGGIDKEYYGVTHDQLFSAFQVCVIFIENNKIYEENIYV